MCGITGIVPFGRSRVDVNMMASMNQALRHRGPDDEGVVLFPADNSEAAVFGGRSTPDAVYASPCAYCPDRATPSTLEPETAKLAFGHRRLSILDLSASGHQPMSTEDGRFWITYNGEIYNFEEIRRNLTDRGEHFVSETDTEVLLKAYRLWGKDCLSRLNGMWAFAIYDRHRDVLFLSRDRFGKKPLYYYVDREWFVFASEIKAILQLPFVTTAPDIQNCIAYLEKGSQACSRTTEFESIFRFSPGAYAELPLQRIQSQGLIEKKFWRLEVNHSQEPFDEKQAARYSRSYYDLLLDAVRIRLRADVNVGSALSGGLDSSSIVYLINQLLKAAGRSDRQITFSTVYKSKEVRYCDESLFIEDLATFLDVDSKQIEPRAGDIPAEHRRMIYAMDTPPEGTCMSGWHTFKCAAANHVKVTLDGQGADEQLAGYLTYLLNYLMNLKGDIIKESAGLVQIPGAGLTVLAGLSANLAKRVLPERLLKALLLRLGTQRDYFQLLSQRLSDDVFNNLTTLIHYSDSVSMAHSVESRMPFMDYRLVEFTAGVPTCYKIHKGWTKYIARRAMDAKLPDDITWRKDKMGWPVPEKHWFQHPLKDWFYRSVNDSFFLKELGYSPRMIDQSMKEKGFDKPVRLLNMAVWHDVFFNRGR